MSPRRLNPEKLCGPWLASAGRATSATRTAKAIANRPGNCLPWQRLIFFVTSVLNLQSFFIAVTFLASSVFVCVLSSHCELRSSLPVRCLFQDLVPLNYRDRHVDRYNRLLMACASHTSHQKRMVLEPSS